MPSNTFTDQFSPADVAARQDYIVNRPPRLPALPPEERSERQQTLLDEMSMVVVDGVRKPREDLPALEIIIRHADLYLAHLGVGKMFLSGCDMSIRDRELAVLRIGWLSQAPMEWASHVKIGKRNGVTPEEIERIIIGSSAPEWTREERALIKAVEELHFNSMICDETWAELASFFDDRRLIELVILAGQYKTVAYYQNALRLPLPEGNLGLLAR